MDWIESLKTGVQNYLHPKTSGQSFNGPHVSAGGESFEAEPSPVGPDDIGASVLAEYPGLRNSPEFKNGYQVRIADPNRVAEKNQKYPKRGAEYFARGEKGGIDQLVNPGDPNKAVLEIYDTGGTSDPNKIKGMALGEAIHGAKQDPAFSKLRDEFYGAFSPDFVHKFQKLYTEGKLSGGDMGGSPGQSFGEMMDQSGTDAFIRAHFMKSDPNYPSKEWLSKLNPRQQEILGRMESYLKTGKGESSTQEMLRRLKVGINAAFGGSQ
jgi:hypothetical protein